MAEKEAKAESGGKDVAQMLLGSIDLSSFGIDVSEIESIEFGTAKGSNSADIVNGLSNQLERISENKNVIKPDSSINSHKRQEDVSKSSTDIEDGSTVGAGHQTLENLVREFKQCVATSDWLEENTVEKMQEENPQLIAQVLELKQKIENGEEVPLAEEFEIIPESSVGENEVMKEMTSLFHHIKSSDWLQEQTATSGDTGASAFNLMVEETAKTTNSTRGEDELRDLMNELKESIKLEHFSQEPSDDS